MNADSGSAPKGLLVKPTIVKRLAKIATNLKDAFNFRPQYSLAIAVTVLSLNRNVTVENRRLPSHAVVSELAIYGQ